MVIISAVPSHVSPDRVVDFNLFDDPRYAQAGGLHAGLFKLAEDHGRGMRWTPHNGGHWYINDHELIFQAARDTELFSSRRMTLPPLPEHLEPRLIPLTLDPPEHGSYRLPLMRAFSPGMVAALEPHIRALAIKLIEAVRPQGACDFIPAIAEPLPVMIFMRLMGMDISRLTEFRRWALGMVSSEDAARADAFVNVGLMMAELIEARRTRPGEDLISRLMEHQIDGRDFTTAELVDFCLLLFIAGLDTVANSLVFGMRHLASDPALQQRLRADPSRIPEAAEELLRCYGVVTVMRIVTRDARFGGVELKAGDRVMLMLAAGNLDPKVFPDPTTFDLDRENKTHIGFNAGPHRCVGSHLARLELRIFYEEWFRRMPTVSIAPAWRPATRAGLTLALTSLPIIWRASDA